MIHTNERLFPGPVTHTHVVVLVDQVVKVLIIVVRVSEPRCRQ